MINRIAAPPAPWRHPPMQPDWIDAPHHRLPLGDFPLENGGVIQDCHVSYVVHGQLNAERNNAVLALSAIGSTHHRLDFLIGPGRAFNPASLCIICVDALGNGLSSSPSNSLEQAGTAFPRFSIRDMVESQRRLVQDHLGIERLRAIVGASMGGMQTLQWAVSHPQATEAIIAMTPMARTSAWSAAINAAARAALMADPDWTRPSHTPSGLPGWIALMQLISGRTPQALEQGFGDVRSVQTWLEERVIWQQAQGQAAIDWIYQSYAYDDHDVGTTPGYQGDTQAALRSIAARTLIAAPPLDLYNPIECARDAADIIPDAEFRQIPSSRGHQAASSALATDARWLNDQILSFLDEVP